MLPDASNIRTGENPSYTVTDFLTFYPQFGNNVVPSTVIQVYINLANASVKEARWHDYWSVGMANFVAHFCTLYLQATQNASAGAAAVLAAGETRGLKTSKSVGPVSVSYDYETIASDLDGWAAWKLTNYGIQFATMAKMVGKGGMLIW